MKNVKLIGVLISVLLLIGCGAVSASDRVSAALNELDPPEIADFENGLDYFEAKLDYFSNVVEILTTEALKFDADAEVIRSESESLLEQIITERDNYRQFNYDNFELHCYEDEGIIVEEEHGAIWCDADSFNSVRRSRVRDRFDRLSLRSASIEYLLLDGDGFDKLLNELEAGFDVLEAEFDARLAYLESNDPELWYQVNYHRAHWDVWEDIMADVFYLRNQLIFIKTALELNPDLAADCSRARRLGNLHHHLGEFMHLSAPTG